MKLRSVPSQALLVCLLVLLLAAPGSAQIITSGIDMFQTLGNNGSVFDFSGNPLPPDFFCLGSPSFAGTIDFQGVPLDTQPPGITGDADTIVERLTNADLSFGNALVPIVARALSLKQSNPFSVFCNATGPTPFEVSTCLCGTQPITYIDLRLEDPAAGCGRFSGQLSMNVCLTFTNLLNGSTTAPVSTYVDLNIQDMPWCDKPLPSTLVVNQPFQVNSRCVNSCNSDDTYLAVPPTSNFFPGTLPPGSGLSCLDVYGSLTTCHSSYGTAPHEHCINPVCCGREGQPCPQ